MLFYSFIIYLHRKSVDRLPAYHSVLLLIDAIIYVIYLSIIYLFIYSTFMLVYSFIYLDISLSCFTKRDPLLSTTSLA